METVAPNPQISPGPLVEPLSWAQINAEVARLAARIPSHTPVYGVPTGGSVVAALLTRFLHPEYQPVLDAPAPGCVVVDDLVDSGATLLEFMKQGYAVDALFRKPHSPGHIAPEAGLRSGWLHFPWDHTAAPTDAVVRLLEYMGEDPRRDGLLDTPKRVVKAFGEMTQGYRECPEEILSTVFDVPYDQVVILRNIEFTSLCEHHLLPFTGTAHVGYIPGNKVVGLSKLARLVHCFARRLQVQERLTRQIAETLQQCLAPLGTAVIVTAHHQCMSCRGVRQPKGEMVTSSMTGAFRSDATARAEFLALCGGSRGVG